MTVELDHIVRSGEPQLRARGIESRSVITVRHPRGSYIVSPLLSLEVATPENQYRYVISKLPSDMHESTDKVSQEFRLTSGS